jgi:hypothetical protein
MLYSNYYNIQKHFFGLLILFYIFAAVLATIPKFGRFFQASGHSACKLIHPSQTFRVRPKA